MDENSDSDDEVPMRLGRPAGPNGNGNRLPLHQFLRLVAGGRMIDHAAARTNEELVQVLVRGGVLRRCVALEGLGLPINEHVTCTCT
jgi:hypothetical protein